MKYLHKFKRTLLRL